MFILCFYIFSLPNIANLDYFYYSAIIVKYSSASLFCKFVGLHLLCQYIKNVNLDYLNFFSNLIYMYFNMF